MIDFAKIRSRTGIGEQFSRSLTLEAADIATFAIALGDANRLHVDEEYAKNSRYGGIIASGPHVSGVLLALVATHFSRSGPVLGLEFALRFTAAARAGDTFTLAWEVTGIVDKPSLKGCIVEMQGNVSNQEGVKVLAATGNALLTETL